MFERRPQFFFLLRQQNTEILELTSFVRASNKLAPKLTNYGTDMLEVSISERPSWQASLRMGPNSSSEEKSTSGPEEKDGLISLPKLDRLIARQAWKQSGRIASKESGKTGSLDRVFDTVGQLGL